MHFHFIGDRTDRLFSKGQRLLDQWLFEEAIESFDRAIETDTSYAHIYLYKGIALAELGRYEAAVVEIQKGAHMNPGNFVFPMYMGCVHLDEGKFNAAETAFNQSSLLSTTNSLVKSYQTLMAFLKGDSSVLERLHSTIKTMPESFQSRFLVSLASREPSVVTPSFLPISEVKTEAAMNTCGFHLFNKWYFSFLDWRVRRLMGASKYERVIELLQSEVELNSTLATILQEAKCHAKKDLTSQLDALDEKSKVSGNKQVGSPKRKRKIEELRRSVLLRLADLNEADNHKRFRYLEQWIESFQAAAKPKRLQHFASDVLVEMAEFARSIGHFDLAISLCQESRSMGYSSEVDWVEGFAVLATGDQRLSRRLFERYGRNNSFSFVKRVSNILNNYLIREASNQVATNEAI